MPGKKGMKWKNKSENKVNIYTTISDKMAIDLRHYCLKRDWHISQAVRNILFWFLNNENNFRGGLDGESSKRFRKINE